VYFIRIAKSKKMTKLRVNNHAQQLPLSCTAVAISTDTVTLENYSSISKNLQYTYCIPQLLHFLHLPKENEIYVHEDAH
jgi:hypothetical protein